MAAIPPAGPPPSTITSTSIVCFSSYLTLYGHFSAAVALYLSKGNMERDVELAMPAPVFRHAKLAIYFGKHGIRCIEHHEIHQGHILFSRVLFGDIRAGEQSFTHRSCQSTWDITSSSWKTGTAAAAPRPTASKETSHLSWHVAIFLFARAIIRCWWPVRAVF